MILLHGKQVRYINGRYFAIPKPENRAGRIAQLSITPPNLWDRVMRNPLGSQVICNQKRADGRRDARMARFDRVSRARDLIAAEITTESLGMLSPRTLDGGKSRHQHNPGVIDMKLSDILSQAETTALIVRIGEAAQTLTTDIHTAAVSTLDHARAHGDWTGITRLMDTLPKSQRVQALKVWYSEYSNGRVSLSVDPDTKQWRVNKDKFGGRTDADFRMDDAVETTYADLTKEKDPSTLGIAKFLKSLERTATNSETFTGTDIPKVSLAARDAASRITAFVKSSPEIQALLAVK